MKWSFASTGDEKYEEKLLLTAIWRLELQHHSRGKKECYSSIA